MQTHESTADIRAVLSWTPSVNKASGSWVLAALGRKGDPISCQQIEEDLSKAQKVYI